jgi:gamma-glutamyltranspeptidase/glutathione hydrolase
MPGVSGVARWTTDPGRATYTLWANRSVYSLTSPTTVALGIRGRVRCDPKNAKAFRFLYVRLARPLIRGTRGAIACGHPLAAEAAGRMFASGGNAADAAVAAGAALCVLVPDACGLGGDALAILRTPDAQLIAFNGSGDSPASLRDPIPPVGGGTVTVPGAVAALADLHGFGSLPWERVLAPAIELAERGMPLSDDLHRMLRVHHERLMRSSSGWPLLRENAHPGALMRQPLLAAALRTIAEEGPAGFYQGVLAQATVRAVGGDGGWLTADDLARHRTALLDPIVRPRLGMSVAVQPPVSQATLLLCALGALEDAGARERAERTHVLIEALEAAFAHRDEIADPTLAAQLPDRPLSIGERHDDSRRPPNLGMHTVAVAVADGEGRTVSMLLSVFENFGSGLLVPEGGFLLNDRAQGFTSGANAPAPHRRPVHTLSPALIDAEDRTFALCTPGADGQVQTLAQLLTAIALDGATLPEAMDRARFRTGDGVLAVEHGADRKVTDELRSRGHNVQWRNPGELFGVAAAAGLDHRHGTVFAACDPRRESWAVAV